MNEFDDIPVNAAFAVESMIENLEWVNFQIADLKIIKEKLEQKIIEKTGRATFVNDEETGQSYLADISMVGRHKHVIGRYKVTIKTDYNYSIDKAEYEILKNHFSKEFNPVIVENKYRINLKAFRDIEAYGDLEDKKLCDKVVTKTPAKPSVTVELNS